MMVMKGGLERQRLNADTNRFSILLFLLGSDNCRLRMFIAIRRRVWDNYGK